MSKLKSTHTVSPLAEGWTEHRAPTGHLYYYNATTKQSTYKRPTAEPKKPETFQVDFRAQDAQTPLVNQAFQVNERPYDFGNTAPSFTRRQQHASSQAHRRQAEDRPKHKQPIPGAEPWLLIRTKLRRRFVHNPETGESFWKFPANVMKCVIELDRIERERRERHKRGEFSDEEKDEGTERALETGKENDFDSDDYEEVEVTDEEDEESLSKRPRTGNNGVPEGPVEFGEDDIAFQLAQLEAQASENDSVYSQEAPELSAEDARALFADLLDDLQVSPYTPWDSIISEGRIIDDDRYSVLPNMRTRREVFDEWSKARIAEVKALRETQSKQDPLIPYMELLSKKATPKLYWQEFRRKFQREAEMKDRKLSDKDREKWYREHIQRLKLSESQQKKGLRLLLESLPNRDLNKATRMDSLPGSLLRDVRYISLPEKTRNAFIEGFIAAAAPAPVHDDSEDPAEELRRSKIKAERERREKAMADREKVVREQHERERKNLAYSKALLHEKQDEVRQAMESRHDGLRSQLRDSAPSD